MRVHGHCHCGAIAYEAEVDERAVNICHCLDCQTLTGSAFRANIQAPAATFILRTGQPRRYVKTGDSGAQRVHAFCETCGGPVYSCDPVNPKSYSLRVGALDERAELGPPVRQIWAKRRLPWVTEVKAVPSIEGQP
jgi:hypothetical protein